MTDYTERRLEKVDWREIDGAIMDFQIHVRKVTGGNDHACVDSTKLKSAIKQILLISIHQAEQEAVKQEQDRIYTAGRKTIAWHSDPNNQMFGIIHANTSINAIQGLLDKVKEPCHGSVSALSPDKEQE